jgi:hypothetical protein
MQSDSKEKRVPPGAIDNTAVAKQLSTQKGKNLKE